MDMVKVAMNGVYVDVKDLPETLQRALKDVDYAKKNINIQGTDSVTLMNSAGDGARAFYSVVDVASGRTQVEYGNWGGASPFGQRQVDLDDRKHKIPMNGALIKGIMGRGQPVYATIYVHHDMMPKFLPADEDLSEQEKKALYAISSLTSKGRADHFQRARLGPYSFDNPFVQSLSKKGLVTIAANGGIKVTTEGKNQAAKLPASYSYSY